MKKRSISLFVILIANIIILAHSAVIHNHEKTTPEVCNNELHKYASNNNICPHNDTQKISNSNTAKGHNSLTFEQCQLEDIYIRPNDNNSNLTNRNIDISITLLYIPASILKLLFFSKLNKKDIYTQYISPLYKSCTTKSLSLRAPPLY